jgi:hypothetical protein
MKIGVVFPQSTIGVRDVRTNSETYVLRRPGAGGQSFQARRVVKALVQTL